MSVYVVVTALGPFLVTFSFPVGQTPQRSWNGRGMLVVQNKRSTLYIGSIIYIKHIYYITNRSRERENQNQIGGIRGVSKMEPRVVVVVGAMVGGAITTGLSSVGESHCRTWSTTCARPFRANTLGNTTWTPFTWRLVEVGGSPSKSLSRTGSRTTVGIVVMSLPVLRTVRFLPFKEDKTSPSVRVWDGWTP